MKSYFTFLSKNSELLGDFVFSFSPSCQMFQSHTKHLLDFIKSTKEEAEEMAEKLKQRATLHAKLVDEFEKHNRNVNRLVG